MEFAEQTIGNVYLVSGLAQGNEVFLGKAVDEPNRGFLPLEGKALSLAGRGVVQVRPFTSEIKVDLGGDGPLVQQLTVPEAIGEATQLLAAPLSILERSRFPRLEAWVRSALGAPAPAPYACTGPLWSLWRDFRSAAEGFRRTLFDGPAPCDTDALDQLSDLEGELTRELGRIVSRLAVELRDRISRHVELVHELAALPQVAPDPEGETLFGWSSVCERIEWARGWARREGRTALVQDLSALGSEALQRPQQLLLHHGGTLDALITETFSERGLPLGVAGIFPPGGRAPDGAAESRPYELAGPASGDPGRAVR